MPAKKTAKKATKKTAAKTSKKTVKKAATRKPVKKAARKTSVKKAPEAEKIKVIQGKEVDLEKEKPVGEIIHYYGKIKVGVIEIAKGQQISVGETLYYMGNTTDFTDVLKSMQEYGKQIKTAKGKKQVGVKVKEKVRKGDKVFKIVPVE